MELYKTGLALSFMLSGVMFDYLTLCDWLCHMYNQLPKLGAKRLVLLSGE